MEIVIYLPLIASLWISGYAIHQRVKYTRWKKYTASLKGRVVRFEDGFSKEKSISPYGEITTISSTKDYKIRTIDVRIYPTESYTKKVKAAYDKQFEQELEQYKKRLSEYERLTKDITESQLQAYRQGYVQLQQSYYDSSYNDIANQFGQYYPPEKPVYNFTNTRSLFTLYGVKKSVTKLMPKFFDIETGSIIKPIQERKGVKRQKNHMPRIYKYLFLLALVMFVFSLVSNVDNNMPGFFHWFISH